MSKLIGKDLRVRVYDGSTAQNLSSQIDSIVVNDGFDTPELTGFTDQAHNYLNGLYLGDLTIAGFLDAASGKTHATFTTLVGSSTAHQIEATVGQAAAATTGDPRWVASYFISSYNVNPTPGGPIKFTATAKLGQTTVPAWGTAATLNATMT